MNFPLLLTALLAMLPLVACREKTPATPSPAEQATTQDTAAASPQEIESLQRDIQHREQTVGDLEAVVVMERAKVAENPDYDQSFLLEALAEQEKARAEIEEARQLLEGLNGAGE